MYRTARNFGESKFLQIAKFLVLARFNLANLWPWAIEDVYDDSKWQIFILANGYQNAKFAKFSFLQNFPLYSICTCIQHALVHVHEFSLSLFNGEMYVSKGKKFDMHTLVFFNFHSLLSFSSLSSFVSLPSPLLSLRLELTERQLLLTRTALDNALKDLNQMKYISLCLSSFTLLLLIPLFLCLLVLISFFISFIVFLLFLVPLFFLLF